ncbi:Pet127p [Sporobolomyces koalae]|uniref:Pet127p n=1 Tax=Sporobolomyces koalae TaxID=500713 RepID=UPI00316F7ADF
MYTLLRSSCPSTRSTSASLPARSWSHGSTFASSRPASTLSKRLLQRRHESSTLSTDSDSALTSSEQLDRDVPPHQSTTETPALPQTSASNLPAELNRLTERAINLNPKREEETRRNRLREQARANRIKWQHKDQAKLAIQLKRQQSSSDNPLPTDLRRRMGFANPGKDKRDLKRALRVARLASGGQLTDGEKDKLAQLEAELSELKRKQRSMVPWEQLTKRSKSMQTYKIARRMQRDEDREREKSQQATKEADSPASAVSPSASFDESISSASIPSPSTPADETGKAEDQTLTEPLLSTQRRMQIDKALHAEAARSAWSLRRNTITQEIKDLEIAISGYLPPSSLTSGVRGPEIPKPAKRSSPPLLKQFVDTLQVSDESQDKGKGKEVVQNEVPVEDEVNISEQAARLLMGAAQDFNKAEEQAEIARERRGRISPRREREERQKHSQTGNRDRGEKPSFARGMPLKDHPALQSGQPRRSEPRELSTYPHRLSPADVQFSPTESPFADVPIAKLSHNLSRVLFNPGVHFLRDPRSGVYNFSPEILENVPKITEFEFNKLPAYITSSQDETLKMVANREKKLFSGSTSSTVGMLCQIYFWLSKGKEVNTSMLSEPWSEKDRAFSMGQQLPVSVILNYNAETGTYSIDADKSFDATSDSNVLADYGHLMEKLLTTDPKEFKRFLVGAEDPAPSEADHRQAYHYATTDDMVLRSQLDAVHEYLPGNGTFDLKTRGTVAIRQDRLNYEESAGYKIDKLRGPWESFEREYYDLIRSAFLKYQFQARIGCMDGIFVAYHSTARFYGFQYLPISEMDEALFDTTETGQQVFKLSVGMLEKLLREATECFPEQNVSVTWAADPKNDVLRLFVTPHNKKVKDQEATEQEETKEEPMTLLEVRGTNYIDGEESIGPVVIRPNPKDAEAGLPVWQVGYEVKKATGTSSDQATPSPHDSRQISNLFNQVRETQMMFSSLMLPTGVTQKAIEAAAERAKEAGVVLDPSDLSVRFPLDSGVTYRKPSFMARDLRKMSRDGMERTVQEEKEREGDKVIVVKSSFDVLE